MKIQNTKNLYTHFNFCFFIFLFSINHFLKIIAIFKKKLIVKENTKHPKYELTWVSSLYTNGSDY